MKKTPSFVHTPQNAWERYTSARDRKAMDSLARRYLDFLTRCKTERETIAYVLEALQQAGYGEDAAGPLFVRQFRGKALVAARRGTAPLDEGLHLVAAHVDSPRLDLKQRPLVEQPALVQAKTHYYGGIRKYQWLARPLALHGVLVRQDASCLHLSLGEEPNEPVFSIADLLPHLAADHNRQKLSEAFSAEKLNLVFGHCPDLACKKDFGDKDLLKNSILKLLHEKYGLCEEDFISAELQAVPAGAARFVGLDSALLGGYGHDDRLCVFAALSALLKSRKPHHSSVLVLWDKEEIGSEGATGARSRFLDYCLADLLAAWQPGLGLSSCLLRSRALSADVAPALDPDWQELHDKHNAALLGYGPCFAKFTGARGKYEANDADAEYVGWLRGVLNARKIPWQMAECGKVDQGGGGTVALFLAAYGMDVIDIGPAVLGTHSPFELASKVDLYAMQEALEAFFESSAAFQS